MRTGRRLRSPPRSVAASRRASGVAVRVAKWAYDSTNGERQRVPVMRRLAGVTRLVMLLSVVACSALQVPVGAHQTGSNETTIRGAVVQIAQVVEVVAEDGTRQAPLRLPGGTIMSSDLQVTLIPSEANAEVSPSGLILLTTGSGTVVSADGLILTNAHVVGHSLVQPMVDTWQANIAQQGGRYQLRIVEDLYGCVISHRAAALRTPRTHLLRRVGYGLLWGADRWAGQPRYRGLKNQNRPFRRTVHHRRIPRHVFPRTRRFQPCAR